MFILFIIIVFFNINGHISPPPKYVAYMNLEWLSYFEHVIQSLLNTSLFGVCNWNHTKPHCEPKVVHTGALNL